MNTATQRLNARWPELTAILPALLLLIAVLWLFRSAAIGMVDIWLSSTTFNHGFLVPPIVAWLAWRMRSRVSGAQLRPVPLVLIPLAVACLFLLVGELAEVNAAMHFGLVALVVLLVPALYGWTLARKLSFPLLFLFFAVPFGDFTVPYLQQWTADVTVAALRASGIPVYREGMQFIIPSGTWSVVEACSGVRYLIASFMVGTLFAHLNYQSAAKRGLFMLASLLVPILANWIRAYTIVMIGHVTGSPMILGFDHTVYGWWLFGAIVFLMFWIGARWSDPDPEVATRHTAVTKSPLTASAWPMSLAILALLGGTQALAAHLDRNEPTPSINLVLPGGQGGWQGDPAVLPLPWEPAYANPTAVAQGGFRKGGRQVTVWVAYYAVQDRTRRLVSVTNQVLRTDNTRWAYQLDAVHAGVSVAQGREPSVGTVRRGSSPSLLQTERLRVWHWYWIGNQWTSSPAKAKLWQALGKLRGLGDSGAMVMLTTPYAPDADAVLADFAKAHLDPIGKGFLALRSPT